MTPTVTGARPRTAPRRSGRARLLLAAGWTLMGAGCVVLLYLVYSLLFTGLETSRAQAQLREDFQRRAEEPGAPAGDASPAPDPVVADAPGGAGGEDPAAAPPGTAVALMEFHRPGSDERPVRDDTLVVVEGVSADDLRSGPGRYPGSADPGGEGNFAVAGHRTTYGAPFFRLDELQTGDEVRVTGRDQRLHVYRVVSAEVVAPSDNWVLAPDPLETARPLLTLTTCHPRFSAAQRLIVFAELVP